MKILLLLLTLSLCISCEMESTNAHSKNPAPEPKPEPPATIKVIEYQVFNGRGWYKVQVDSFIVLSQSNGGMVILGTVPKK